MQQQYEQLVETYRMIQNQYDQMLWMARRVPVDMATRYRALATPWTNANATNTYGTTGAWLASINTGLDATAAYRSATESLDTYGGVLSELPAEQTDRIKKSYATVELTDGANLSGIQTVGQLRANAPGVERAIGNLEADSLSADPAMNTEIAVLNKINAASLIALRASQDTNKLLVNLAEQQILQAKRQRDAEAQSFRQHIRFKAEGRAVLAAHAEGASAAMLAWRMP
jgi:hypothetical protein